MNKSKLLSLLLALAMVLSMVVVPVAAETATEPEGTEESVPQESVDASEPVEAAPADCPNHEDEGWTEVAAADWAAGGDLRTGHYKLTENVELSTAALTVAAGETVCIDLAGKNITMTKAVSTSATATYRVFENSGILSIMDSTAATVDGTYTSGVISGGWVLGRAGGNVYAQGGNIYNAAGSVFNLYSGTISGGIAQKHGIGENVTHGGNIFGTDAVMNIYGGLVTGGTVKSTYANTNTTANRTCSLFGGNIFVTGAEGELNISGGTITNGVVNNGFYCTKSQGTFSAAGGNIGAASGAAITISGGTISNGTVVSNNQGIDNGTNTTLSASAHGGNIYIVSSATSLTITGGTISGGSVSASATAYGSGTMTTTTANYNGGNIYVANGSVEISGATITGGSANYGGSIYTNQEITISNVTISGGTAETYGGNIYINGTVNLEEGAVVSGGTVTADESGKRGGNVYIASSKTLNLKDNAVVTGGVCGPYVTTEVEGEEPVTTGGDNARGGNIFVAGTFNMYGGTVSDGFAGWGNNVMLQNGGEMNMYGGTISGGSAEDYSVLNQRGTVKIYGGDIEATETGYDAFLGTGTAATNGSNTYIYGGNIAGMDIDRLSNLYMYGGYLKTLAANKNFVGTITVNNGRVNTSAEITVPECAHNYAIDADSFNIWHAAGTCATCAHTYAAIGADTTCATCEAVHATIGGKHTYVDGACSVCAYAEPAAHTADCAIGCENVTWVEWDGVTVEDGGHYFLGDNLAMPGKVDITAEMNVCIDLNGYTLTAPYASRAFVMEQTGATLTVFNSAETTGTFRGAGVEAAANGAMFNVGADNDLHLYDITVTGGITSDAKAGGNIYVRGHAYINNCKILNGKIKNDSEGNGADGGNIAVYNTSGHLELSGGTVVAGGDVSLNRNSFGGNIYAGSDATIVIVDAEITGGRAIDGGNIYLMNSKTGGNTYMYGGSIHSAHEDSDSAFFVYGSSDYISNFYMFGGYVEALKDNRNENEIKIYSGTLGFDPRTANYDGSSMLGECACVSYNEETGIYTVSHATAETCGYCEPNSKMDPTIFEYVGGHVYTEGHVCDNCELVTAKIDDVAYTELSVALDAATAEDTVVLQRNIELLDLDLYTTLDLNGYSVDASGIVDAANADAHIVDNVGTGVVNASDVKLYETNAQLAVNTADGYKYEAVELQQKIEDVDATTKYVKFIIADEAADTYLDDVLVNGDEYKARITVAWNGGADSHSFYYNADLMKAYALDAEGNSVWGEKMFTCVITGLDQISADYTITCEVESCGVVVEAITVE